MAARLGGWCDAVADGRSHSCDAVGRVGGDRRGGRSRDRRAPGEIYAARGPSAPPAPVDTVAAPTHDPRKPTAVVLLGSEGANAADVLAPYKVLASTGAFNLYTLAP
jgi:hypothetical protein